MPRNLLTDSACRTLRPGDKPLQDGGALSLHALDNGEKSWRFRYRLAGRNGKIVLGRYPALSLAEARLARDEARAAVARGTTPRLARLREREAQRAADGATVAKLANQWFEHYAVKLPLNLRWKADYARNQRGNLDRHIIARIGHLPVADVTPRMLLELLDGISPKIRGRIRQMIEGVLAWAMAQGLVEWNAATQVRPLVALATPESFPHVDTIEAARKILAAVEATPRDDVPAMLCHRLIALTALRVYEATGLRRCDLRLDGPNPRLEIAAERMKGGKRGHVVPLAPAAVETLRMALRFSHGTEHVFTGVRRGHPLQRRAIGALLQSSPLASRFTPHGWRSTFATLMNERGEREGRAFDRQVIDLMLAHKPTGVSAAEGHYNRAQFGDRRREIALAWAELLLVGARPLAEVIGLDAPVATTPQPLAA
jgi:integrase